MTGVTPDTRYTFVMSSSACVAASEISSDIFPPQGTRRYAFAVSKRYPIDQDEQRRLAEPVAACIVYELQTEKGQMRRGMAHLQLLSEIRGGLRVRVETVGIVFVGFLRPASTDYSETPDFGRSEGGPRRAGGATM